MEQNTIPQKNDGKTINELLNEILANQKEMAEQIKTIEGHFHFDPERVRELIEKHAKDVQFHTFEIYK